MERAGKCYAPAGRVVYREIAGEGLLVPVYGDVADICSVFTLNEVGRCIWQQLDGAHDVASIVDAVCDRFEVERATAEADVREFLEELRAAELIVEV